MISSHRSWDLNKICFKSGVPIIENVMIERVSMFFMRYLTFSQIICLFIFLLSASDSYYRAHLNYLAIFLCHEICLTKDYILFLTDD